MSAERYDSEFAANLREEQPDSHYYTMFKSYGFEPGEVVYKIYPAITMDALKEAQYGSTYTDPKTLRIKLSKEESFNVVVQTVSSLFIEDEDREFETGYFPHPNWLIEGWVLNSNPTGDTVRVRMCLEGFTGGQTFHEAWIQRVPKNPRPNGPIRWVELS